MILSCFSICLTTICIYIYIYIYIKKYIYSSLRCSGHTHTHTHYRQSGLSCFFFRVIFCDHTQKDENDKDTPFVNKFSQWHCRWLTTSFFNNVISLFFSVPTNKRYLFILLMVASQYHNFCDVTPWDVKVAWRISKYLLIKKCTVLQYINSCILYIFH